MSAAPASPDPYEGFTALRFERPAPGLLHLVLDAPNLNALDAAAHRELADGSPVVSAIHGPAVGAGPVVALPALDASLAPEFYGFGGPDAAEGLASHRERRPPVFGGPAGE